MERSREQAASPCASVGLRLGCCHPAGCQVRRDPEGRLWKVKNRARTLDTRCRVAQELNPSPMSIISQQIEQYTAANSGLKLHATTCRCHRYTCRLRRSSASTSTDLRLTTWHELKCYKGYQMERDLKGASWTPSAPIVYTMPIVTAFDSIVAGHPDFLRTSCRQTSRACRLDEHLPVDRVPRRVFLQLQAYMLYGNWPRSLCHLRKPGDRPDHWLLDHPVVSVQNEIHAKFSPTSSTRNQESRRGVANGRTQFQFLPRQLGRRDQVHAGHPNLRQSGNAHTAERRNRRIIPP